MGLCSKWESGIAHHCNGKICILISAVLNAIGRLDACMKFYINNSQANYIYLWLGYVLQNRPQGIVTGPCWFKSPLDQEMAWCRQITRHYLGQCSPKYISPYDSTRQHGLTGRARVWHAVRWVFFYLVDKISSCAPHLTWSHYRGHSMTTIIDVLFLYRVHPLW